MRNTRIKMPSWWFASLLKHGLSPLLSVLLVVVPVVADDALPQAAQQPPAAPAPSSPAPAQPPAAPAPLPTVESLKVIPLAGRDEVNDIQRKVMAPLVVDILDQND